MADAVTDSTVIDAPADVIRSVILDLPAYPQWAEGVRSVEVDETDDQGRPLRASFDVDAKVVDLQYQLAYEYADGRIAWSLVEGTHLRAMDGSYELLESDGSTSVTYRLEVDIAVPVPGFMKRQASRQILKAGLSALKERVEAL